MKGGSSRGGEAERVGPSIEVPASFFSAGCFSASDNKVAPAARRMNPKTRVAAEVFPEVPASAVDGLFFILPWGESFLEQVLFVRFEVLKGRGVAAGPPDSDLVGFL